MGKNQKTQKVCSRLIESAGKLFAEKGFRDTTIREICKDAHANQASVNYYFRDKEKLFDSVLVYVITEIWSKYPTKQQFSEPKTKYDNLKSYIRNFLMRHLSPEIPGWFSMLLRREIIMNNPKANQEIHTKIQQSRDALHTIVKEFLGDKVSQDSINLCSASIVGQIMYYCFPKFDCKHHLFGKEITILEIEKIVEHIYSFSIAGLKNRLQELKNG